MNKYYIIIFVVLTSLFCSCQKESEFIVTDSEITANSLLKFTDINNDGLDSYIGMRFSEYFDSPNENISATFYAGFKEKGMLVDAGTIKMNDLYVLDKTRDNRYLTNTVVNKSDFFQRENSISFKSKIEEYNDFKANLYIPSVLNVSSNIGKGKYFDKSQNLDLSWKKDKELDNVYIAICSAGVPCIIKEVKDTGKLTISGTEFNNFKQGAHVSIYLGRGKEICYEQNRKQICTYSIVTSRTPGLEVR